jgi:DNA polymerase-1
MEPQVDKFKLNERSIRNFPMQSNGAEMLRLACSIATEKGISICAPVHDAILIESPVDEIHNAIRTTKAAMAEASRIILDGFELRSDAKIFIDRFTDARGQVLWGHCIGTFKKPERCTFLRHTFVCRTYMTLYEEQPTGLVYS